MIDATPLNSGKTDPLKVDNMSFMLERLGRDCAPLQFLRELTQNSIEAIQKTLDGRGTVLWDSEWNYYELKGFFINYVLSITELV